MDASVFTKLHISNLFAENVNVQRLPTVIEIGSYFIIVWYIHFVNRFLKILYSFIKKILFLCF